jgi:hypothetical protein
MRKTLGALALLASCGAAAAPLSPQVMNYYGGPVVAHAQVVMVNWGAGASATLKTAMPVLYADLVDSDYWSLLELYSTAGAYTYDGTPGSDQRFGRGTFVGSFSITPSACASSCEVTSAQVNAELASQIAAGNLPATVFDAAGNADTVYLVYFPSTVTVVASSGSKSCMQFCAAYSALEAANSAIVPVGLFPNVHADCPSGCEGGDSEVPVAEKLHSQLLVDMVTDPGAAVAASYAPPMGWYANVPLGNSGSPAYFCRNAPGPSSITINGHSHRAARIWSEFNGACLNANRLSVGDFE